MSRFFLLVIRFVLGDFTCNWDLFLNKVRVDSENLEFFTGILSICLTKCLSAALSVSSSIFLIHLPIYSTILLSVYPSVCLPVHQSLCLSFSLSIRSSVNPSYWLSVHPSVYALSNCMHILFITSFSFPLKFMTVLK